MGKKRDVGGKNRPRGVAQGGRGVKMFKQKYQKEGMRGFKNEWVSHNQPKFP